jgi:hypothetical protein
MKRRIALVCGTILWLAGQPLAAWAAPAAPVHTNKTKFRIPFKFDAAEMQALGAREVRLYVSRDRGGTWQHTQSVPPDAAKFQFQAPAEGEYWFVVRTLDGQNRMHPDSPTMEPGLMVVVDTTAPQIKVELRETSSGRVQLAWAATDAHVDVAQLRLEYIQPGQPDWQTVGVVPRAIGQTEWSVPQAGMVAVRASIGDHAKNSGRAETQLRVSAAPEGTRPATPASRQPVALPSLGAAPDLAQSPLGAPPAGLTLPAEGPAIRERSPVFAQPVSRATDGLQTVEQPVPSLSAVPNLNTVPTSDGGTMSLNPAPGSGSVDMSPSIASGATRPAGDGAAWGDQSKKSRLINSRRFHLGYSIQDVGPSGIGAVEIYATDTDGQRWFRYGEDADRQSPAVIEVPGEGTYGFALCVRSGAGLSSEPPVNGTPPPIVVRVDQTAPTIEIAGVEQGRGGTANRVVVNYRYNDDNPADQPIQISFSATGADPWQPIQGWQENTGRFVWAVGPNVPARFFLRVEARDSAGNQRSVATSQPVLIDLSRPTARIIDIEAQGIGNAPGL